MKGTFIITLKNGKRKVYRNYRSFAKFVIDNWDKIEITNDKITNEMLDK